MLKIKNNTFYINQVVFIKPLNEHWIDPQNTEDYNELERILQSDLLTKNKLIDLYQKTAEDSGEEVERLKSAVHEMKAAVLPISEGIENLLLY